ncbi:MAG: VacJ family lipoprotein [Deltaproteobacteria bacterium]|nr:VacJ family lipoprotein [Deltaproteobacteria bacterium]
MHSQKLHTLTLLAALALTSACATTGDPDPWRPTNEKVFRFNERVDQGLLEPVAEGYDTVTASFFQIVIGNFFQNTTVPRTFVNNVLQGKPLPAVQDLGRFSLNLIAGIGGLVDVASEVGIPKNEEDFGQTLGRWGVGPGPYVVLPLAGPYNVRDTLAAPVDVATNPTTWVNVFGLSVVRVVNTRAQYLEEIAQARKDAVDYYVFVRDAYLSSRERAVRDGAAPKAAEDDLYDIDELEDDAGEGAETDEAQP